MVNIQLPDVVGSRLLAQAQKQGVDASRLASELIDRALSKPSIDDVLAPFRKQVEESGLSDEQLDALFEEGRNEAWQARSNGQ